MPKLGSGDVPYDVEIHASHLPPNEVAMLVTGKSVGTVAKFARTMNTSETPSALGETVDEHMNVMRREIEATLNNVIEANITEFGTDDFDTLHNSYQLELRNQDAALSSEASVDQSVSDPTLAGV